MSAYDKVGILTFDTAENTIITNRCMTKDILWDVSTLILFLGMLIFSFITRPLEQWILIAIIWERFLSPVSLPTSKPP